MPKPIDPEIVAVLTKHGFTSEKDDNGREVVWNSHGVWVIRHWVLEVIAANEGIRFDKPEVLVAEPRSAVVLVSAEHGGAMEWSIGEAVVDLNYTVKPKQPGYPFAIAEKRAKDRVILKLLRLHGKAYSEEEAEEFKKGGAQPVTGALTITKLQAALRDLHGQMQRANSLGELKTIINDNTDIIEQCSRDLPGWYYGTDDSMGYLQVKAQLEERLSTEDRQAYEKNRQEAAKYGLPPDNMAAYDAQFEGEQRADPDK